MAYVIEGLLFAFHLRGDLLDVEIHTLLVITIFLTAVVIFAEIQHKSNVLLSALRPILVIMQGVWFVQAAFILFRGKLTRALQQTEEPAPLDYSCRLMAVCQIDWHNMCSLLDSMYADSPSTCDVSGLHHLQQYSSRSHHVASAESMAGDLP